MKTTAHLDADTTAFLDKARHYCAYAEQCESGVCQKLASWGASMDMIAPIIKRLQAEGYLDDKRYARAYCESKILRQHWGRQKVVYQLRSKHLSREVIDGALSAIDGEAYLTVLRGVAERKRAELGDSPNAEQRLAAFLASRGFTTSEISQVINL